MQTEPSLRLATRRTDTNPNHHLWNNNGTWWLHFTLHSDTGTKKRHRISLKTPDPESARRKRDRILTAIETKSGNIAA
jgi:hypothetical protein